MSHAERLVKSTFIPLHSVLVYVINKLVTYRRCSHFNLDPIPWCDVYGDETKHDATGALVP